MVAVLNRYDVAKIALSVWPPESAVIAVAIAKRESGWNTNAHNGKPPDNSYGLWQINMIGQLGVNRRAQFHLTSNEQLFDPYANARAAFSISSGGSNWRPWSVYTNGSYRMAIAEATEAVKYIQANPGYVSGSIGNSGVDKISFPGIPDIPNPIEPITKFVGFVTDKRNWLRLGMFLDGLLLLALGAVLLAKRAATGSIAKEISKALGGRVGKAS